MTLSMYDSVDYLKRSARRQRRQAISRGEFLRAVAFCRRRHVSPTELRRLMRHGDVFDVKIGHRRYFSAVLASVKAVQLSRLNRICRQLAPLPGWSAYDALISMRGSLGDKAALQLLRRSAGYRRVRWYAGATVADSEFERLVHARMKSVHRAVQVDLESL